MISFDGLAFHQITKISNLVIGCDHSLISQRIFLKLVMKHFVESQWFRFDDCLPQPELIHDSEVVKITFVKYTESE